MTNTTHQLRQPNRPSIEAMQAKYDALGLTMAGAGAKRGLPSGIVKRVIRLRQERWRVEDIAAEVGIGTAAVNKLVCGMIRRVAERPVESSDGRWFAGARSAAATAGVCRTAIVEVLRGRQHTAGGMTWKYSQHRTREAFDAAPRASLAAGQRGVA
jgi:hypothetical protein